MWRQPSRTCTAFKHEASLQKSGPISPPALPSPAKNGFTTHVWKVLMGEQSNEPDSSRTCLLLISFLGGIWQNGSHFMSEGKAVSSGLLGLWARWTLSQSWCPWCFTPTMPSSAAATVGNNDWLYCVGSSRNMSCWGRHSWLRACSQMRKVRIHKKAKTKPDTTTVPSLKAVCAEWILWRWSRQQERPQRHCRKVSGCESGWEKEW